MAYIQKEKQSIKTVHEVAQMLGLLTKTLSQLFKICTSTKGNNISRGKKASPGQVAHLSQYTEVAGLIPSQGTYKKQQ